MHRTAVSILILAGLVFSLAACQPALTAPAAPLPLTGAAASRLGAAALMIRDDVTIPGYTLVPVLAGTGQPVKDAQPVLLGTTWNFGFSKDRSQMVFFSHQGSECQADCLHLMDLRAWKETVKPIPTNANNDAWFIIPDFDAKSGKITLILNKQTETVSEVQVVDLAQGKVVQRKSLPANIMRAATTPQGALALYGIQNAQSAQESHAYLALLDGADLHLLWEQTLPDVQFIVEWAGDPNDPTKGKYLDPAAAFSADGSLLYVAAADKPVLSTVDFQKHAVHTATIQPRASLLDRLMALGAGVAYAKTMNGISKSGVLSPDGRYFYVAGHETKAVKNAQGDYSAEVIPLGLQVIDTRDGTLVKTVQTNANDVTLTQDGKRLLLSGWDDSNGKSVSWTDVMDTQTMQVTQRLEGYVYASRLLDGSLALLVSQQNTDTSSKLLLYRPGETKPLSQISAAVYLDWVPVP